MDNHQPEQATTLRPNDAPNGPRDDGSETKREQYRRLRAANTLRWNGKWRDEKRQTDIDTAAIVDSIAGQLELTPFQQERAHRYINNLPDSFVQAYSTAMLAFCVCGISGKEDEREYHPNQLRPGTAVDDTTFANLARELGFEYRPLYSCWMQVRGAL